MTKEAAHQEPKNGESITVNNKVFAVLGTKERGTFGRILSEVRVPLRISHKLRLFAQAYDNPAKAFEEEREKIIDKYCMKKDGVRVMNNNIIEFGDNIDKAQAELQELMDMTAEIKSAKISVSINLNDPAKSDIPDGIVSGIELEHLEQLLDVKYEG